MIGDTLLERRHQIGWGGSRWTGSLAKIFVVYEVLETEPVIVIRPITAYEPMPE
jgi:hypothetical protein